MIPIEMMRWTELIWFRGNFSWIFNNSPAFGKIYWWKISSVGTIVSMLKLSINKAIVWYVNPYVAAAFIDVARDECWNFNEILIADINHVLMKLESFNAPELKRHRHFQTIKHSFYSSTFFVFHFKYAKVLVWRDSCRCELCELLLLKFTT